MKPFRYLRPSSISDAINAVVSNENAMFIAGGTNLIDLMKRGVSVPDILVDINQLPIKSIEYKSGVLRIGALARNSDVAQNKLIREKYPLLVQALNAGASGQLRNMATIGGNILQKTRCTYFYDTAFPCNKRQVGIGCAALEGTSNMHAIFGRINEAAAPCIAVNPSDMSVALVALGALILIKGPKGERKISLDDFYRLPGERPDLETNLEKGELVVAVEIPDHLFDKHAHYLKVRDRASYAFALVSVAAGLDIVNGKIKSASLVMGGVAHKPWRLHKAEARLVGENANDDIFRSAADLSMRDAIVTQHNAYKVKLASNAIVGALKLASGIS